MVLPLDHIVIAVRDLDRAIDDYRALGFTVRRGGFHANRATHNALIVFADGVYLELLAATGESALPDQVDFSPMLAGDEGLAGFALRTDNIEAEARRLTGEGFAVGTISEGAREKDGRVMRWKLALIDGGFVPFLIQDVTPRVWRVPDDPDLITHANHAVGVAAVEIVTRDLHAARDHYARLIDAWLAYLPPNAFSSAETFGGITLVTYVQSVTDSSLDTLPDGLRLTNIPQEYLDRADPAQEPSLLEYINMAHCDTLDYLRAHRVRVQAMSAALGDRAEALFAVDLLREDAPGDTFTPDRTHGVYFEQQMGVPPTCGADILHGLDEVDWAAIHHSYKHNPTAIPRLLRALASAHAAVREYARETLIEDLFYSYDMHYQDTIETIPFLGQLIDAPEVDTFPPLDVLYAFAMTGLDTYGLDDHMIQTLEARRRTYFGAIFPVLIRRLSHPAARVRRHVADLLELHPGDEALFSLLQTHLQTDPDPDVRARCLQSLVSLWTDHTSRPLDETQTTLVSGILRDTTQPVVPRFRAARILFERDPARWQDDVIAFFYAMLDTDLPVDEPLGATWNNILWETAHVLDDLPEVAASWAITHARHAHPGVRFNMVSFLGKMFSSILNAATVQATLLDLLDDPDPNVRYEVVNALKYSAHLPDIHHKLRDVAAHDPSLIMRYMAQKALRTSE